MNHKCYFPGCETVASERCSRCKNAYYCSRSHQIYDWCTHKSSCIVKEISEVKDSTSLSSPISHSEAVEGTPDANQTSNEQRECRCMFCGKVIIVSSEEEACEHLRGCMDLQEQLRSPNQFEIPSSYRSRLSSNST
mmetsp:Transcript_20407/g.20527  ORF Transcript_20407/g.20527 Transcript_20407/m.20527 type:complete len:136 (+) Transcript_20407:187-594(+)